MTKYSIIIPVFNQAPLTRQCLEAVRRTAGASVDTVVVDDASTDETPALLAGYGDRLRVVTQAVNRGFAVACNAGAAVATGDQLVFLNNDTIPQPGWLDALRQYADSEPSAAVIGSKLLYPNNTVQHAGVVIGQDGCPRHIYKGFPADHPAVSKSRTFAIVTAACAMIRRRVFESAGGFDTAFRNGLEDADLCLRLNATGHAVHYCAASVVQHLESASPGRFKNDGANLALYRQRWSGRVPPDDVRYYLEDGLLAFDYEGSYPLRLRIDPLLAVTDTAVEQLLATRARQVDDLLRENTRLRIDLARYRPDAPALQYEALRQRISVEVQRTVPAGATILVISKGDGALVELHGRTAWHFPQTESGVYTGHHPAGSAAAVAQLETLRSRGAGYLLIPQTGFWWLEHYFDFASHLESHYRVVGDRSSCLIFDLREQP